MCFSAKIQRCLKAASWAWYCLARLRQNAPGAAARPAGLFHLRHARPVGAVGCFTGQYGGLTRLKTVLDAEAPANALLVDVGDAVGGHEDYDLIEYRYVLRAFAAMNYDALNIGGREAQFSAAQLREIKKNSPAPIISANLLDQASRQPLFDSYRLVRRGPMRLAIIGVLDPRAAENPGAGLLVGDMEAGCNDAWTLRGKAD